MKRFICLITALLCIYSAFAQITTASLSGVVTNQSQEKLVGATVILSHPTTGSEYAVVADVQGRYSLHGIRPSDGYILEVSYVGCESVRREGITLRVGDMHTEDVVLRQSTTLDAVVVTAENDGTIVFGYQTVDDRIDFKLCAHVDTAGRLVQQQNLGIGQHQLNLHFLRHSHVILILGGQDLHHDDIFLGHGAEVDQVILAAQGMALVSQDGGFGCHMIVPPINNWRKNAHL